MQDSSGHTAALTPARGFERAANAVWTVWPTRRHPRGTRACTWSTRLTRRTVVTP